MTENRITRVVLYKHGMAAFERFARVDGDARLTLDFRHDEMDDALKSLTVADPNGRVGALAYDPHPRLSERLDDIRIELPRGGGLAALVGQLIGAEVEANCGTEKLVGRVLGLERVSEAHGEVAIDVEHLSMVIDHDIRRVRLGDIDHLAPTDPGLRRDIGTLLERTDAQRRAERRQVAIDIRGKGSRDVSMAYVVPATVWKTSYRVVLTEEEAPVVLGFALVDNDSQDDWADIELSLVSGLPISFTHDLYSPRRRARPHVQVETEAPIAPPMLEGVAFELADEPTTERAFGAAFEGGGGPGSPPPQPARRAAPAPPPAARPATLATGGMRRELAAAEMGDSIEVATRTQELGDQFRYDVITPVSIQSGHSALVPIVAEAMRGEVVAVYNASVRDGNPLTSLELENISELTLEGGPATIFRGGEYAGEAMIDTMRPGEERLIPFSVELGCHVTTALNSKVESQEQITAKAGYLHHTTFVRRTTTYTLKNVSRHELKVYIDHPADRQAEYVDTPKPTSQTATYDRFVAEVPPNEQTSLAVVERCKNVSTIWISPEQIKAHVALVARVGNPDLDRALMPLADVGSQMADKRIELERVEAEIQHIQEQHTRIRENLKTLKTDNKRERELRERYVGILDKDETSMDELRDRRDQLANELDELRKEFDQLAAKLG